MGAIDKKSKKRSVANFASRLKSVTFFIDRSLGKYTVANALRANGANVEIHDDRFPVDAPDVVWLNEIGRFGWIVLSKDERIRRRSHEITALR